jgi:hypothetical protein
MYMAEGHASYMLLLSPKMELFSTGNYLLRQGMVSVLI